MTGCRSFAPGLGLEPDDGMVQGGLGCPTPAPAALAPVMGRGDVIPRSTWTASRPDMSLADPMQGIRRITVHHSAIVSAGVRSEDDAIRMLNRLRNGHVANG